MVSFNGRSFRGLAALTSEGVRHILGLCHPINMQESADENIQQHDDYDLTIQDELNAETQGLTGRGEVKDNRLKERATRQP